jgi:hypothetical protein
VNDVIEQVVILQNDCNNGSRILTKSSRSTCSARHYLRDSLHCINECESELHGGYVEASSHVVLI